MIRTIRTIRGHGFALAARTTLLAATIAVGAIAGGMSPALAQVAFDAPAQTSGQVRAQAAAPGQPVLPGSEVKVTGQNFKPGQKIVISRGLQPSAEEPATADGEGRFEAGFTLPADAAVGVHPLVLSTQEPYHAEIVELKISPDIPLSGAEKFDLADQKLVQGLYQTAYSASNDVLFVTAAVGRPPIKDSTLVKVDPTTLEIIAQVAPPAAPASGDREGGLYAVYGVAVDEENGTVWVTNTRQNTVAVYSQSDLSLIKQFEPGIATHARDVAIASGNAYASQIGVAELVVFDTKTLEQADPIEIKSNNRRETFSPASLQFDAKTGKLFAVSLSTAEVAIIDTATNTVDKVITLKGARSAIGIAYDNETNRIFVAAQGSDNLLIVDAESGETLHNVLVGAGALNVAFDPVNRLAYVSNRGADTVTVVDPDGNIVANLENAPLPNHVLADGKGNVFAVNKSRGADNPAGDRITRITLKP
ncbi:YncE family protein [Aquamicrobium segne]|uniref:YncE family protein n=1 Tax=Aquamicrobium segne TaxID=469547 RepID=A0ABW0GZ71_9HYPH